MTTETGDCIVMAIIIRGVTLTELEQLPSYATNMLLM